MALRNILVATIAAVAFAGSTGAATPPPAAPGSGSAPHAAREHEPLLYDNIVLNWNEAMLAAVRANPPRPTVTARNLHIVHTAIYDAWAAYDAVALGTRYGDALRRPAAERTEANMAAALSYAAHRAASALYPQQQAIFDAMMAAQGLQPDRTDHDPATPAGVGNLAADAVLAYWAEDGSNWQNNFADTTGYAPVNAPELSPTDAAFDPNRWQPLIVPTGSVRDEHGNPVVSADPASFRVQAALTPQWGQVRPFAMPSGDAVRPPAPPVYGDMSPYVDALGRETTNHQAWLDQYGEVLVLTGALDDPQTGAPRRCIAEFWADGPRSDTPPGHWNQIAQGIALRDGYGIGEAALLYFALTGALHDAAIAAWDAKFHYDSDRPITAIRHEWGDQTVVSWVGPNRGVHAMPGADWLPYQEPTFLTPPFPEYVSGHSTFSMAAATVIASFAGTDRFYDPDNPTEIVLDLDDEPGPDVLGRFVDSDLAFERYDGPDLVLIWPTLFDAARQAGDSRLYGGIHIQDANLRGQEMGREVGAMALNRAASFFDGTAVIDAPASLAAPPQPPL
ncbi:MAG: vanadium-dependent haloperoxidase [Alphaproteobacteria bacterium]